MLRDEMGTVQLVGAGPGPADLLTVRALRAIEGAEALLYDALISDEVLALAPQRCIRIQTGKRAGRASMAQDAINRLMLRLARRGLRVVRLKGGDPSIFGRVGEESDFLQAHGVPVQVTPGVTAACAAAAQFDFPLTHRGEARRVVFATVRVEDGVLQGDWMWGVDPETTIGLYMGRDLAGVVSRTLMAQGVSPDLPVAAVENAGSRAARLVVTRLADMEAAYDNSRFTGPVVTLICKVAARAAVAQLENEAPLESIASVG